MVAWFSPWILSRETRPAVNWAGRERTAASRGVADKRPDLGNVELGFGHVVEEVREAAGDDAGDDLHDLGLPESSLAHGPQAVVADLPLGFEHCPGELQGGVGAGVLGRGGPTFCEVSGGEAGLGADGKKDRRAVRRGIRL